MGLVNKLKNVVGNGSKPKTLKCNECGETFESHIDPDEHWASCDNCGSRNVELPE